MWPDRLHNIFLRYLINDMIFERERERQVIEYEMRVLVLSVNWSETFLFLKQLAKI